MKTPIYKFVAFLLSSLLTMGVAQASSLWSNAIDEGYGRNGHSSICLEASTSAVKCYGVADDFFVPPANIWSVQALTVAGYPGGALAPDSFSLFVFKDSEGAPGALLESRQGLSAEGVTPLNPDVNAFHLNLLSELSLTQGRYWVSVVAVYDTSTNGSWYWYYGPESIENDWHRSSDGCLEEVADCSWDSASEAVTHNLRSFYFSLRGGAEAVPVPMMPAGLLILLAGVMGLFGLQRLTTQISGSGTSRE